MKQIRRPWGSVKELVIILCDAGMSMPEMASSTGITYGTIRYTCKRLQLKPRSAFKPLHPYYDKTKQQQ